MKNRIMYTLSGGGGRSSTDTSNETASRPAKYGTGSAGAFTMAEILLSLTIIGVVAAITLPSLTGNINERTWNTQRKALYARMSQAISLMPALNGFGSEVASSSENGMITEAFLTDGLSKVLKINNICDNDHIEDCGISTSYTNMKGQRKPMPRTMSDLNPYLVSDSGFPDLKAAAFETQNGESIIAFYNKSCNVESFLDATAWKTPKHVCVNFIYDLNGNKGPNTVGKDIGIITVLNAVDSTVVAPMPTSSNNAKYNGSEDIKWGNAAKACTASDSESRVPNIDELVSLFVNNSFVNLADSGAYAWSSTVYDSDKAWAVMLEGGSIGIESKSNSEIVRCIKR